MGHISAMCQLLVRTVGVGYMGGPHLIILHRYCVFYKLKARTSTSRNSTTGLIVIITLLRWSGAEPAMSPRCACSVVGMLVLMGHFFLF